ncbi:MAG: cation diffusion facilitator family transporter [Nanoarchaeota archaeon]|nr:cation diffusion facilitator family transporter [Nanoarchaeota archaeon]
MKEKISVLGIVANVFLAIGKIITGIFTKSASILADGVNSGTDVFASTINLIGIKAAKKPADKEHPYGHEKAEVISGFLITLVILGSGFFIIYDAIRGFLGTPVVTISYIAFIVIGSSALINFIMSKLKIHYGKKENSVSLLSDGIHSRIDVLVSLGVFIGLFLTKYWIHFDSIIALLIGLYIIKEAFGLGKETTDILLGASSPKTEEKIKEILKKEKTELVDLKTQKLGGKVFAEITIELPSKLKIDEADKISGELRKKLTSQIQELRYISIQIKSHDLQKGYFKPSLGKWFGWQRKGRFKNKIVEAQGRGPDGYCVCSKCGYKQDHKRGVPCSTIKCPKCTINLTRE